MGKLKTLTAFLVGIVLVTVGFALNTFSATTPPQASDGYYELDSYEDLVWFQQYIDAGNLEINARLTADIVANENLLNDNGSLNGTPSNTWTPIGRNFTLAAKSYNGTLDGAGHSITGLFFYDTKGAGYYGLFAKMGRGTVKNLAIVDSFFGGVNKSNYVGTFVGEGYAVNVENCYSNAIIYASDYYGGIVGKTSVANIRNCLYAGTFRILGSSIYADPIVKKNSTDNSIRVYNCYYKGDCGLNSSTVATAVTTNGLASGQVTYLLNRNQSSDVWRQNIDIGEKDSNPTLDSSHHIVFYYNNTYTNYCSVHSWKNGICSVCSSVEEPQLVDDYYEIGNYGNLVWFQQYVDAGNVKINAKLTTNIVANENLLDSSGNVQGTPKYNWTPIGKVYSLVQNSYRGIFDGAGYSISGLYANSTNDYCGFFGKSHDGTIKNLSIVDSYFGGENCSYVGTFIGINVSNSSVENCYSSATIVSYRYSGGIAGEITGKISNSLYNGKISGKDYCNAIASDYRNFGKLTNCYYNKNCGASSERATLVTDKQLASGEVTYLLNGSQNNIIWYQNVDKGEKDNAPTLNSEHYRVYKGDNIYTNDLDKHSHVYNNGICDICNKACTHGKYKNGICTYCEYGVEEPQLVGEYYEIGNYGNLIWFQRYVDAGNVNINAKLTSDIVANENLLDSSGNVQGTPKYNWTPIGRGYSNSSDSYNGVFDGTGYSISGLYSNGTENYCGFFGKMNKGIIKNLSIVDSYFGKSSCYYVGSFVGYGHSYSNIENCYSNATTVGKYYCCGIAGETKGTVSNCLYNGKIKSTRNSNAIATDYKSYGKLTNCYYNENCGLSSSRATAVTDKQLASGEVTYLLNGSQNNIIWYQNVDKGEKDNAPTLNSEHYRVYKGDNIYTNDLDKHSHVYNNGICDICNKACTHGKYKNGICTYCEYGVEEPQLVGEYYEIGNYGNLIWFQRYVDAGNVNINAKLTSDIVANENLLDSSGNVQGTPKYNWTPIGRGYSNSSDSYNGVFDGTGYSISGLYSNGTENYCGFFGKMNKGIIKNLSIVDSYFGKSSCYYVGSFVGYGHSYSNIENCYSNATTVGKYYCCGIAGETKGTVSNCLYNGKIKGTINSNAIASDRYNEGTITNCYYNENCGLSSSRAIAVTDDQLSSGEVAYLLNGNQSAIAWYQNIDRGEKDNVPTLNIEHYTVYKNNNGYTNILLGDVNDDGKVDRKDAVLILKNISGMALDKFSTENADYNGDGVINSLDVIAIMKSI